MSSHNLDSHRHIVRDLVALEAEAQIDYTFVAEEAGDLPLSAEGRLEHDQIREHRARRWFPDLLFALTHKRYRPEQAERLWKAILSHRDELRSKLGRNPGIAVATLDYMTNVADAIERPTIIPEPKLTAVADVATKDVMTGLHDHSSFQVRLRKELVRARRYPDTVSLVMLDIDHFKRFNDQNGHQAGDELLRRLGAILLAETRDVDLPARYGGEEFAIVLPSTDRGDALLFAERVRLRIEREIGVTVSQGVASYPDDAASPERLISAADEALYESKRSGRNRTTSFRGIGQEVARRRRGAP